jgi:vancomycin resistance protein YoaR
MKKITYSVCFILLVFVSLICGYYILVNTVFSERVLPNVAINHSDISFKNEQELVTFVSAQSLPTHLYVQIENYEYSVPIELLHIKQSPHTVLQYGKGADIKKVLKEGISLIEGKDITIDYEFDITPILNQLPPYIHFVTVQPGDSLKVLNCDNIDSNIVVDTGKVYEYVRKALQNDKPLRVMLDDISFYPNKSEVISFCNKYRWEEEKMALAMETLQSENEISVNDLFQYVLTQNGDTVWDVKNKELLKNFLESYKKNTDVLPLEAQYEIVGDKLLLLHFPEKGTLLDIPTTINQIELWLKNPTNTFPLVREDTDVPKIESTLEIMDFTKLVASGKTRIDLIRDGVPNRRVPNAQAGVEEMQNRIIQPGEEFSYIDALDLHPGGKTGNGRQIGGGVCNATTTLFRAVLEAGFPITERHYHLFYVQSYEWGGYPINIVDAGYYTYQGIREDLKFVNDLPYPVLLRVDIHRDDSGYQFHTINVYTSSKSPDRKVELTNWKKWSIVSKYRFSASFDRIVYTNGVITRTDTFMNKYVQ